MKKIFCNMFIGIIFVFFAIGCNTYHILGSAIFKDSGKDNLEKIIYHADEFEVEITDKNTMAEIYDKLRTLKFTDAGMVENQEDGGLDLEIITRDEVYMVHSTKSLISINNKRYRYNNPSTMEEILMIIKPYIDNSISE